MEKSDFLQSLEARIDALIQTCKKLADENQSLRESQNNLTSAHAALLEKNALARSRIEAMIARLKSMEVNS
jgi:cell division protein ZapB